MRESTASGGSTSTVVDNTVVLGGADNYIGKWLVLQDADASTNDGAVRRVTDSAISSNVTTFTFMPVASASVASSDTYELWDGEYPPSRINDLINQSIISVTGLAYDPIENISLHADKRQTRFDVPSNISMVSKIEYREKVTSTRIHDCGSTFDEKTDGDFTQSLDTQDRKLGGQSLKMVIAAGASAGDFVTDSITSKDLSKYDTVEMWVKSTVATSAGNLKLLLDDTASCASPLETLEIPALSADTWTFVRMSLSNPETDTAIISVGLEYDSDLGACAVWIDDIKAVANDTAEWAVLSKHLWQIDKEARDLVLVRDGKDAIGYALMKLTGGDKPALLTDDSSTTEIDGNFIIAHATNLALISSSGGPATDPDAKRQLSAYWSAMAERARKTFPMLVNVRTVE
tara:strand:+ start:312 stop:1520 length:1209 start_codon:yes stop_codon:yes gene_type:complete